MGCRHEEEEEEEEEKDVCGKNPSFRLSDEPRPPRLDINVSASEGLILSTTPRTACRRMRITDALGRPTPAFEAYLPRQLLMASMIVTSSSSSSSSSPPPVEESEEEVSRAAVLRHRGTRRLTRFISRFGRSITM